MARRKGGFDRRAQVSVSVAALGASAAVAALGLYRPAPLAAPSVAVELPRTAPPPVAFPRAPRPIILPLAVGPEAAVPEVSPPPPRAPDPPKPIHFAHLPPPVIPSPGEPAWRRFAVASGPDDGRPMIAIVIDDMGLDRRRAAAVLALPGPLTISFMTYAEDLPAQAAIARARGDEIMLHLPMEPLAARFDPGPNALRVDLDEAEIRRRLEWDLGRLDGVVGANNHMGSRFTEWVPGMTLVADALRMRGLFFLDSRTSPRSVGMAVAGERGVPHVARDIFLDDVAAVGAIERQLGETEAVARRRGFAIAIGHPYDSTVEALAGWLPGAAARGFRLVPVSAIVAHDEALQTHAERGGG